MHSLSLILLPLWRPRPSAALCLRPGRNEETRRRRRKTGPLKLEDEHTHTRSRGGGRATLPAAERQPERDKGLSLINVGGSAFYFPSTEGLRISRCLSLGRCCSLPRLSCPAWCAPRALAPAWRPAARAARPTRRRRRGEDVWGSPRRAAPSRSLCAAAFVLSPSSVRLGRPPARTECRPPRWHDHHADQDRHAAAGVGQAGRRDGRGPWCSRTHRSEDHWSDDGCNRAPGSSPSRAISSRACISSVLSVWRERSPLSAPTPSARERKR